METVKEVATTTEVKEASAEAAATAGAGKLRSKKGIGAWWSAINASFIRQQGYRDSYFD